MSFDIIFDLTASWRKSVLLFLYYIYVIGIGWTYRIAYTAVALSLCYYGGLLATDGYVPISDSISYWLTLLGSMAAILIRLDRTFCCTLLPAEIDGSFAKGYVRWTHTPFFLRFSQFGGLRPLPKTGLYEKQNCHVMPDEKSHGRGARRESCKEKNKPFRRFCSKESRHSETDSDKNCL